jgi:acetyl-CoA acyltransferase
VARTARDVVFVDGVRTPFGKAGPNGLYAETRADDMVVSVIRELIRRNPALPPERIGEVAIAATTQTGDQGLTIGRSAAVLAGLPKSVPGYAIDRMCAGAMTAVTTAAGSIALGATDTAIAGGVEHMGHHPMGSGVDPQPAVHLRAPGRPVRAGHGLDSGEPARPVPGHHPRAGRCVRAGQPA